MATNKTAFIHNKLLPPIDLMREEVDMRGKYFASRRFENVERGDFRGAVLWRCYPSGLEGAIEIEPVVDVEGFKLTGEDLSGITRGFLGEWFHETVSDIVLKGSHIKNSTFKNIEFLKCDFQGSTFENVTFQGCLLRECIFTKCTFRRCRFEESGNAEYTHNNMEVAFSNFDFCVFIRCYFWWYDASESFLQPDELKEWEAKNEIPQSSFKGVKATPLKTMKSIPIMTYHGVDVEVRVKDADLSSTETYYLPEYI